MQIVHRTLDPVNDRELLKDAGGCLQGHVTTTRSDIETVFGPPSRQYHDEKVTTEWVIALYIKGREDEPPVIAWIYDWKNYVQPGIHEEITWNIAGEDPSIVELVKKAWPQAARFYSARRLA